VAAANQLAAVYAERWEHELVFDGIETHVTLPDRTGLALGLAKTATSGRGRRS